MAFNKIGDELFLTDIKHPSGLPVLNNLCTKQKHKDLNDRNNKFNYVGIIQNQFVSIARLEGTEETFVLTDPDGFDYVYTLETYGKDFSPYQSFIKLAPYYDKFSNKYVTEKSNPFVLVKAARSSLLSLTARDDLVENKKPKSSSSTKSVKYKNMKPNMVYRREGGTLGIVIGTDPNTGNVLCYMMFSSSIHRLRSVDWGSFGSIKNEQEVLDLIAFTKESDLYEYKHSAAYPSEHRIFVMTPDMTFSYADMVESKELSDIVTQCAKKVQMKGVNMHDFL